MREKGEVLTVKLRVRNPEEAKALWDVHSKNQEILGCSVEAINDGDLAEDQERFYEYSEYVTEQAPDIKSFDEFMDSLQEKKKQIDTEPPTSSSH
jgi:hypothetical protein